LKKGGLFLKKKNIKKLQLTKKFLKRLAMTAYCFVLATDILHTQTTIAEDLTTETVENDITEEELQLNVVEKSELQELIEKQYDERKQYKAFDTYVSKLAEQFNVSEDDILYVLENKSDNLKNVDSEEFNNALKKEIKESIKSEEIEELEETIEYDSQKVRLTTYQYTPNGSENSLGGSIGEVGRYISEGSIYFDENGFAIWKGGTTSKLNGKVYGTSGKDYLIVATATEYLIGQYGFLRYNEIDYYKYNDTFKLQVKTKNGTKTYDAIVLDSCGASMCYGEGMQGQYPPTSTREIEYSKLTNNKKIDIFTAPLGYSTLTYPEEIGVQLNEVVKQKVKVKSITDDAYTYVETNYLSY
jgi:uncharacterized protein (DUF2267 family)